MSSSTLLPDYAQANRSVNPEAAIVQIVSEPTGCRVRWQSQNQELDLDALAFALEFEQATVRAGAITEIKDRRVSGKTDSGGLSFCVFWSLDGNLLRKQVLFQGEPDPQWGKLLRLVVHEGPLLGETGHGVDASMGWRDDAFSPDVVEQRKPEEGAGRLPACGYPVFLSKGFVGLEHPMGFNEWLPEAQAVRLYHHPLWLEKELVSQSMVLGIAQRGDSVRAAFMKYFASIRKQKPQKVSVEINTFWTDPIEISSNGGVHYAVSLEGYRAMIKQWIQNALQGERGLIDTLVLDAGWSDRHSLYAPKSSIGGPDDAALAAFAHEIEQLGVALGLWISTNGLIGVDRDWAVESGYSISNQGMGAGYSAGPNTWFVCLDDLKWEEAFKNRLQALNRNVPVASYKVDWDNEGVVSPRQQQYPLLQTVWEENVNAMIRMFAAASGNCDASEQQDVSGPRIRGAWWLSPWWFQYVSSAHLSHSGDLEHCSLPALNPREASQTSRDMLLYEHLVRHRTPIAWDVVDSHEFAHASRCAMYDSDESWLNTLVLWVMRGGHAIQLYMPPYGVRGWRAEVLCQVLRWLRNNQTFLLNAEPCWIGGNPGLGEVYGFHYTLGEQQLLLIRNPLAVPQSLEKLVTPLSLCVDGNAREGDWQMIFPNRAVGELPEWIGSNQILVFQRGAGYLPLIFDRESESALKLASQNHSVESLIPELHQITEVSFSFVKRSAQAEHWKLLIPYCYDQAEMVMEWEDENACHELQVAAGRYEDGVSSAALPITWIKPHWRASYTEGRSRLDPDRINKVIARIPIPVAGATYLSFKRPFSAPTAIWIEGGRHNLSRFQCEGASLPCQQVSREVLWVGMAPVVPSRG